MTATEKNEAKHQVKTRPLEVNDLTRLADSVADLNFADAEQKEKVIAPARAPRRECCPVAVNGLFAALHPEFSKEYVERFQLLRTQLMLLRSRMTPQVDVRMVAVMSTHRGEGKSFTATNLASVLANYSNQRVLLVDANPEGPELPIGVEGQVAGLRQALEKPETWEQSVYAVKGSSLSVMPRGPATAKTIDLEPLPRLFAQLREHFEWVVLDGTSFSSSPDSEWISSVTDGTLLVTQGGNAKFDALKDSLRRIPEERMAGVVFNERKQPSRPCRLRIKFSGSWLSSPKTEAVA